MTGHAVPVAAAGTWWPWVVCSAVAAGAYLGGVRRLGAGRWRRWRTASFLAGCGLVALGASPVVARSAGGGFVGHTVAHLVLGMYAPLALVLGAPLTLLLGSLPVGGRRRLRRHLRRRSLRLVTTPAVAALLDVGGLVLVHVTPLYAASTRAAAVHHLVQVHFLVAGSLLAWVVAGPDPLPHRWSTARRIGVVVVAGGVHGALAKLLYARAAMWPPGASVSVEEVERAAQWLSYGGHVAEAALLVALLSAWYRRRSRTGSVARSAPARLRPVLASPPPARPA